jgi:hypothetical protein
MLKSVQWIRFPSQTPPVITEQIAQVPHIRELLSLYLKSWYTEDTMLTVITINSTLTWDMTCLCNKPEGRVFETWWDKWIISIYVMLPAALGPGVYSASSTNEYHKQKRCFWGVKRCRCVGLTTLLPSVSRLSRQCGILNISQPYRPPRSDKGIALLYGDRVCFLWGTNWTVNTATSSQYLAVNCEPIV